GQTSTSAGNMAIGATGLPHDAYRTGSYIAAELRMLGINLNFAPTVDVYRNSEADVIGSRAFGDTPEQVGILGLGFFRGHENERVVAAAKHFPGHGNAVGDSHGLLPAVTESFDELYESDLLPYRMLMREGIPAVLSAHVAFPGISDSPTPATLSPEIMQDLLRDTLGFEGIAITDDMHMGGATLYAERQGWSFGELQVRAIEAGNDMLVLSQTPALNGEIWSALKDAYEQRPEFRARVEESVKRILSVKDEYLRNDSAVPPIPDTDEVARFFPHEEAQAFFENHARRAVSVVRGDGLPLDPDEYDRVVLAGNVRNFFLEADRHFPEATESRFSYSPRDYSLPEERRAVREDAANADLIVFGLSNRNSLEVLQELEAYAESVVVVSTLSPLLLAEADFVDRAVAVYGLGRESFRAGFDVLTGNMDAEGTVPLQALREPAPQHGRGNREMQQ
ncbi:MAG: glycoside hydrolase family 3 protein, partial [bacterium]